MPLHEFSIYDEPSQEDMQQLYTDCDSLIALYGTVDQPDPANRRWKETVYRMRVVKRLADMSLPMLLRRVPEATLASGVVRPACIEMESSMPVDPGYGETLVNHLIKTPVDDDDTVVIDLCRPDVCARAICPEEEHVAFPPADQAERYRLVRHVIDQELIYNAFGAKLIA